ncbi:MAG: urate hydroxylase PuuD [Verrucomicrobiae bacterium]|nr:urate hydroxylase PuuD [Verrucomicrobiae bacterium]
MEIRELLDLIVRWVHLIAGIMWIGNSMLFNWLDRNLIVRKETEASKVGLEGELWMIHSGGFYEVKKMPDLPAQLPGPLHWFWLQATITWVSGFCLLILVYYMGGAAVTLDPAVSNITQTQAILIGIGLLIGAWFFYDLFWRSPISKTGSWPVAFCFALLVVIIYYLTHTFSGRAAYLHVGAMLGTLMIGNVWTHIIPSQRQLVAAVKRGEKPDNALALRAKQRSIHNNYITFPVLFIMISNHFAFTYGHKWNWIILTVIILGGAGVRHFMNIRFNFKGWIPALVMVITLTIIALLLLTSRTLWDSSHNAFIPKKKLLGEPVTFLQAEQVIQQRCVACHSSHPTDPDYPVAPVGVRLDSPELIKMMAQRIKARAVLTQTMPLANRTHITPEERELLGRWIDQGAKVE